MDENTGEIPKEERKRIKKEEKMRVASLKHKIEKEKSKKRKRESIKRKRSEFAKFRDMECEGMNQEERNEWMKKQRQIVEDKKQLLLDAMKTGQRVAIDAHYTKQMDIMEKYSVVRQLSLCHKANKDAQTHVSIHICGDAPDMNKTLQQMGAEKWSVTFHRESVEEAFGKEEMVYLSPDAEQELESIEKDKVYVIGGLVDRSVAKNQSLTRSEELGVERRRLPIAKYYPECRHPILNINTVMEIIIHRMEGMEWKDVFLKCIPNRKVVNKEEECDYRTIHNENALRQLNENKVTRYQMKHALHILCEKKKVKYSLLDEEAAMPSPEAKQEAGYRFKSTLLFGNQVIGVGYGKSHRASQGRASWYGLVHLGAISRE